MVNGIRWEVVPPDAAARDWDGFVSSFEDRHIRQSHAWGRLKTGVWTPAHAGVFNGPTPLAAALILERRLPLGAASLLWINGGPMYRKRHARGQDLSALHDFLEGVKERARSRGRAIIRLNFDGAMDAEAQLVVRAAGFARPLSPLGTGLTYRADLTRPLEEIRTGFEKNWRNQLSRAEKAGAVIEFGRSPELLRRYQPLHDALCVRKGLHGQRLSVADLERMSDILGESILFFVVSAGGEDGCGGAVWMLGDRAWFALSSANEHGLRHNLPNAMFWQVMKRLKEQGVGVFDFTGIDPAGNPGVFNFKRGLGLPPVENLGEWQWATSPWLARAIDAAIFARRDSLQ
ncbi:MAG: GNAT family N-acetyltransferase [Elusimicrobiota bacterium]|nr:GNAT family N-acetyltransferase [Elusimicrobiota bacterium]